MSIKEMQSILAQSLAIQLETKKEAKENREENKRRDARFEKYVEENREENKKRDTRFDEYVNENRERFEKTDKFLKDIGKQLGGIGNNLGSFAEEFFFHGFNENLNVNGVKYDSIEQNRARRRNNIEGEYDIVLFNTNKILVVEVKYTLKQHQVEKFCEKSMPRFKQLFPELKNYSITGAFASLSFEKYTKELAKEKGILVFTQSGKNIKKISPETLKLSKF